MRREFCELMDYIIAGNFVNFGGYFSCSTRGTEVIKLSKVGDHFDQDVNEKYRDIIIPLIDRNINDQPEYVLEFISSLKDPSKPEWSGLGKLGEEIYDDIREREIITKKAVFALLAIYIAADLFKRKFDPIFSK